MTKKCQDSALNIDAILYAIEKPSNQSILPKEIN